MEQNLHFSIFTLWVWVWVCLSHNLATDQGKGGEHHLLSSSLPQLQYSHRKLAWNICIYISATWKAVLACYHLMFLCIDCLITFTLCQNRLSYVYSPLVMWYFLDCLIQKPLQDAQNDVHQFLSIYFWFCMRTHNYTLSTRVWHLLSSLCHLYNYSKGLEE